MKNRIIILGIASLLAVTMLAACGGGSVSYKDGSYEGKSDVYTNDDGTEDGNGYGVVNITVKDGAIAECTYQTFEPDGSLKDENYGMEGGTIANRDYYNKAQKAVQACDQYASQLVSSGRVSDVDAISGATINYKEFVEAANRALDQAK